MNQKIANKNNLTYFQAGLLHILVERRFKGQAEDYIDKWAKRIKDDTAWQYADNETRMVIYDYTMANIEESGFPPLTKYIIRNLLPKV